MRNFNLKHSPFEVLINDKDLIKVFSNCLKCYEARVYTFVHLYKNSLKLINKTESIELCSQYHFKKWFESESIFEKGSNDGL